MFKEMIFNSILTSDIADKILDKKGRGVVVGGCSEDASMKMTLRALFSMNEARTIPNAWASYTYKVYGSGNLRSVVLEAELDETHLGVFDMVSGSVSDVRAFMKDKAEYREMSDIHIYFDQKCHFKAAVFARDTDAHAFVFVENLSPQKFHAIQSLIPRYLPAYFKECPLSDLEKQLLASLLTDSSEKYVSTIEKIAERMELREEKIRALVDGMTMRNFEKKIENVKSRIKGYEEEMEEYYERYRNLLDQLECARIEECGLLYQKKNGEFKDDELAQYLIRNKLIDLIDAEDGHIKFIVNATIAEFDPEMAETMLKNERSFFYEGYSTKPEFASLEVRKKFVKAVFGDVALLKIRVCAYYDLNLSGSVHVIKKYDYPKSSSDSRLTNPHFYFFACLGTYRSWIDKCLREGDVIMAIEQCLISAQALNLAEGEQTLAPFLGQVMSSDKPIIELPDGSNVTPVAALEWLENREKEAN